MTTLSWAIGTCPVCEAGLTFLAARAGGTDVFSDRLTCDACGNRPTVFEALSDPDADAEDVSESLGIR